MAIKETVVQEHVCDICGEEADGYWYMTANSRDTTYNGEVSAEFSCPLDLCRAHMPVFNALVLNSVRYVGERYDGVDEKEKKELLEKLNEATK